MLGEQSPHEKLDYYLDAIAESVVQANYRLLEHEVRWRALVFGIAACMYVQHGKIFLDQLNDDVSQRLHKAANEANSQYSVPELSASRLEWRSYLRGLIFDLNYNWPSTTDFLHSLAEEGAPLDSERVSPKGSSIYYSFRCSRRVDVN